MTFPHSSTLKSLPILITLFLLFFCISPALAAESSLVENASYKNLNPRPYDNCEANDLIKLSACCNDVLADLDDCKAGDLACECCALQSMDAGCYNLCPGNPSTNFLAVLFDDCSSLNDVNACNIPFKRVDGDRPASFRNRKASAESLQKASTVVTSQVVTERDREDSVEKAGDSNESETSFKQKPKINIVSNGTTSFVPMRSSSVPLRLPLSASMVGLALHLLW